MDKVKVEMTAEEQARFAQFKAEEAKKAAAAKAKADRETYKQMVDDEVSAAIPILQELSGDIKTVKQKVIDNFKAIISAKAELFRTKNPDQRSHTFTTSDGNMRLTIGAIHHRWLPRHGGRRYCHSERVHNIACERHRNTGTC